MLTEFQLANEQVKLGKPVKVGKNPLVNAIWDTNALTLSYDQNVLSFEFSALSYATPYKNRYRYKLDGFDPNWINTTSLRRFVTYTNLPAGDYVFRVQATNNDGVWSDQEVALKLAILPPWWETTPFRAGVVLIGVLLLVGGYQWRVFAIRRRNQWLEKEVAERTQALQERTQELQTS